MDTVKKNIVKVYGGTLAVGLPYVLWLRLTGLGIPCLIQSVTGMLCPGCGSTRMFLALLRLDISSAFRHNAAVLCLLIFWNVTAALCFWGKPGFIRSARFLYGCLWGSVAVLAVFGVLRNLL